MSANRSLGRSLGRWQVVPPHSTAPLIAWELFATGEGAHLVKADGGVQKISGDTRHIDVVNHELRLVTGDGEVIRLRPGAGQDPYAAADAILKEVSGQDLKSRTTSPSDYSQTRRSTPSEAPRASSSTIAPRCPLGDHDDAIQPVRAVVRANSSGTGGNELRTNLASVLAPPAKPDSGAFAVGCLTIAIIAGLGMLGAATGSSSMMGPLAVLTGLAGLGLYLRGIRPNPAGDKRWHAAKRRWEAAYYCSRHDAVFIPGESTHLRPEKFRDSLVN